MEIDRGPEEQDLLTLLEQMREDTHSENLSELDTQELYEDCLREIRAANANVADAGGPVDPWGVVDSKSIGSPTTHDLLAAPPLAIDGAVQGKQINLILLCTVVGLLFLGAISGIWGGDSESVRGADTFGAESIKEISVSARWRPQFVIQLFETSDVDSYVNLLERLQADAFSVTVKVVELPKGPRFVLQIFEEDEVSLDRTLGRLNAQDYALSLDIKVVPFEGDVPSDLHEE